MRSCLLWGIAGALVQNSVPCFGYAAQTEVRHHGRAATAQNPNMTMETAQFFSQYNSQRVKIRYGPFAVPPMSVRNGMKSYTERVAQKPCTDCLVTWIQAGLEYTNGTVANADTGLWLHHTVFSNTQRAPIVCPQWSAGDDFFASGNERTPVNICVNGTDQAGYYIGPDDNFAFLVELMNMVDYSREAVLTVTWEYVLSVPAGFDKVKPLWLDIGGCNGSSEQPAQANQAFQYTDPTPWTSNFTGRITWMGAHLHDGGVHLTINKNNNPICDCVAAYGQNPAYIDNGSMIMSSSMSGMSMRPRATTSTSGMSMSSSMDMSGSSMDMSTATASSTNMPASTSTGMAGMNMSTDTVHISSISSCSNTGVIAVGDTLSVTAYYNSTKYSLMTNTDGSLAPIMGIAIAYVADTNLTSTATNSSSNGVTGTGAASASASKSEGNRELGSTPVLLFGGWMLVASLLAVF